MKTLAYSIDDRRLGALPSHFLLILPRIELHARTYISAQTG